MSGYVVDEMMTTLPDPDIERSYMLIDRNDHLQKRKFLDDERTIINDLLGIAPTNRGYGPFFSGLTLGVIDLFMSAGYHVSLLFHFPVGLTSMLLSDERSRIRVICSTSDASFQSVPNFCISDNPYLGNWVRARYCICIEFLDTVDWGEIEVTRTSDGTKLLFLPCDVIMTEKNDIVILPLSPSVIDLHDAIDHLQNQQKHLTPDENPRCSHSVTLVDSEPAVGRYGSFVMMGW
jgi:hypothetical protein